MSLQDLRPKEEMQRGHSHQISHRGPRTGHQKPISRQSMAWSLALGLVVTYLQRGNAQSFNAGRAPLRLPGYQSAFFVEGQACE
jgi:hypothetical protein